MSAFDTYRMMRDSTLRNGENARAEQVQQNALLARQQAGGMIAGGDLSGGANALLGSGDIAGGIAVTNAGRAQDTANRERQQATLVAGASSLLRVPADQRPAFFSQRIAPILQQEGLGDYIAQITPDNMTDAELQGFVVALGGEVEEAPSGYRWGEGGRQEFIPGGPQDPANQRPIVTPYGIMLPPGAQMPNMGGQGAPAPQQQSLGSTVPPGWSSAPPRPDKPSSARPAAGGGERSQPVSVSFRSSQQAQSAITAIAPGVRVTSGARSAADNRRVGGSAGSFHLQDRARDLVPPAGMTMSQLAQKMRQAGFRALDEGDHVHVSW